MEVNDIVQHAIDDIILQGDENKNLRAKIEPQEYENTGSEINGHPTGHLCLSAWLRSINTVRSSGWRRGTWRRLFAKCVLRVTGPEAANACQDLQLCASLKVGGELIKPGILKIPDFFFWLEPFDVVYTLIIYYYLIFFTLSAPI